MSVSAQTIVQQQVLRGFIVKLDLSSPVNTVLGSHIIWFQYNPEQLEERYTIGNALNTGQENNRDQPHYYCDKVGAHYQSREITLNLTIDGLDDAVSSVKPARDLLGGITPELNKYRELLYTRGLLASWMGSNANRTPAAKCILGIGPRIMECRVAALDIKETQFNSKLVPVRAEIYISLQEDTSTMSGQYIHKIYRTFSAISVPGGF